MKKLLGVLVVLVLLVAGAAVAFSMLYKPERAELERRLSAAFGRPATVGSVGLTLVPSLGVEARDVRIERDPSFGEGTFLTVDRVHASLGLWDFVTLRATAVDDLVLENPRLTLVQRPDGRWNFSTLGTGEAVTARAAGLGMPLLAAALGPTPAVSAAVTPGRIEARNIDVTVVYQTVSPAVETTYKGLALEADVAPDGEAYRLTGRITGDSAAAGGEPLTADVPFDATLTPPGTEPVWQARGNVPSGSLATKNFRLDSVRTDFSLDRSQVLRFAPLAVGLYGGTFEGETSLDLSTADNRFRTAGRAAGVAIGDALAPHPELGGRLQGTFGGTLDVTGALSDYNATLASLGGRAAVTLDDARITTVNLLAEIARQGKLGGLEFDEAEGTYAEQIAADVRFEGGRALVERANVQNLNNYASIAVESGWIGLGQPATLEMVGTATLLPPLFEKVAQGDPVAGAIVNAVRGGAQVTVPLRVTGEIAKPSVTVQWGRVLGLPFGF